MQNVFTKEFYKKKIQLILKINSSVVEKKRECFHPFVTYRKEVK